MSRIATLAGLLVVSIVVMVGAARDPFDAPGVATATSARSPIGPRPIAAGAAAGATASATPGATSATHASATHAAAIPPALLTSRPRTAADLPPTLELVSIVPVIPGGALPPPKPISRAEALAAVIGSAQFQDTVSPLARLYFAAFGRFPDYPGLNHYTGVREDGGLLVQIADEFVRGREFEQRYGKLDNAELVERLFVNVLGHASQPDVRAYWVGELDSGRMTRGAVLADLSESGAFRDRTANQVFLSTAYTELLQRTPDPAGYNHWLSLLNAGYPQKTVIDGLLTGR